MEKKLGRYWTISWRRVILLMVDLKEPIMQIQPIEGDDGVVSSTQVSLLGQQAQYQIRTTMTVTLDLDVIGKLIDVKKKLLQDFVESAEEINRSVSRTGS